MNYAEQLKAEVNNANASIITTKFEPKKKQIMNAIVEGIKRIGYVTIDASGCHAGTYEGNIARCGAETKDLNALAEFIQKEGFKVSKMWWGYSSDGFPDMLKITL